MISTPGSHWLHLIDSHWHSLTSTSSSPSATTTPELRVSIFLYPWCFSLVGCLLPICASAKSCFLTLLIFSKHVVRVALYLAHWHGSAAAHLSSTVVGQSLGLQFWDSWPPLSAVLQDQPPLPDHLENHLIWVDSIKVIPLASCRMSLERLVGTGKFPTTLLTLLFQL